MSARYEFRKRGVWDRTLEKLIMPTDPEWREYEESLARHEQPDPMPVEPEPPPQFNAAASGRDREARVVARIAKTDPIAALLRRNPL